MYLRNLFKLNQSINLLSKCNRLPLFVNQIECLSSLARSDLDRKLDLTNVAKSCQNQSVANYSKKVSREKKSNKGGAHKGIVQLSDEELLEVIPIDDLRQDLTAIIDSFRHDLIVQMSLRSGSGIEDLPVEIDGKEYRIKEIGQVHKKGSQLITINMSSLPESIKHVIKALKDSGMNLNPQQESTMIYIPIPKVTHEHRQTLAKNAKTLLNKCKDDIRNVQNNYIKYTRKQKDSGFSEDLLHNVAENIRFLSEKAMHECEQLLDIKVKDLLKEN